MSIKVKVCGVAERASYERVAELRPDYIGHIFYERSPRYLAPEVLATWPKPPGVQHVGVFVNAPNETLQRISDTTRLDALQLHGAESPAQCRALRELCPHLVIIKSLALTPDFAWNTLNLYADACDYFLCDTPNGAAYGGSGRVFDWQLLHGGSWPRPFFLAGGLSAHNVATARAACEGLPLHALDVNSRVETAPGYKSAALVGEFIAQVRK